MRHIFPTFIPSFSSCRSTHFDALKFARNVSGEWTTIGVVSGFLSGFSFTGVRSPRPESLLTRAMQLIATPAQLFDNTIGLRVSVVYQIYTVLMYVSCLANLAAVRPRNIHPLTLARFSQACRCRLCWSSLHLTPLQFYVFIQTVPQDAYHQEKFIRRFIKYFPIPRFVLLGGCFAFCGGLFFLAFAILSRWAAVVSAALVAITGFGLLILFNHIRRIQRSEECVSHSAAEVLLTCSGMPTGCLGR